MAPPRAADNSRRQRALPIRYEQHAEGAARSWIGQQLGDDVTSVVVADDDRDIRDLVSLKLRAAGYDVVTASDGVAALEQVVSSQPDIAVLDVMMPGMSGTEVLRAIRRRSDVGATRVILLTAKAQEADVAAGFALGADDYLVKPFSPRELISRVQAVIARRAP